MAATGDSEEIAGFDPLPSDNSGRIRLLRIVDTEPEGIAAMVGPRSKVRTDDSSGYSKLPRFGYEHVAVQQPPLGPKKVLPLGNRVASLLKRWLPRTHQGTIAHTHSGLLLGSFQVVFQPANLLDHADCCSTDQIRKLFHWSHHHQKSLYAGRGKLNQAQPQGLLESSE